MQNARYSMAQQSYNQEEFNRKGRKEYQTQRTQRKTYKKKKFLQGNTILCGLFVAAMATALGSALADTAAIPEGLQVGFTHWSYRRQTASEQEEVFDFYRSEGFRVTHGEITWAQTEKQEGVYDFSFYENAFRLMRENGIQIYLTLGAGVDGAAGVNSRGDAYSHVYDFARNDLKIYLNPATGEERPHSENRVSFSSQEMQEREEAWIRATVRWLEENFPDVVIAYGPQNEPWGTEEDATFLDYSEVTRRDFQGWLRRRYSTIESLNRAWSLPEDLTFSYGDFSEVDLPRGFPEVGRMNSEDFIKHNITPAAWADFREYMHEGYLFDYLNSRLRIFKEEAPKKPTFLKTTHPFMGPKVSGRFVIDSLLARFAASPYLDILAVDVYNSEVSYARHFYSYHATVAERYGKPWIICEYGVLPVGIPSAQAGEMVRFLSALNPQAVFLYMLAEDPLHEKGYYRIGEGPVEPEYTGAKEGLMAVAGTKRTIAPPRVALIWPSLQNLYDRDLARLVELSDSLNDMGVRFTVLYDYEIRENPESVNAFDTLLLTDCEILRRTKDDEVVVDRIADFAAKGGRVVIDGPFDTLTRNLERVEQPKWVNQAVLFPKGFSRRERRNQYRGLLKNWELLPFEVRGEGIRAFLGPEVLALGNNGEKKSAFEIRLPGVWRSAGYPNVESTGGQTRLWGELDPKRVLLIEKVQ